MKYQKLVENELKIVELQIESCTKQRQVPGLTPVLDAYYEGRLLALYDSADFLGYLLENMKLNG